MKAALLSVTPPALQFSGCATTCRMAVTVGPGRRRLVQKALGSSSIVKLPCFLVPYFQIPPIRRFSATAAPGSKLGRTPLSLPPGVDLTIGEPKIKRDLTSYLKVPKRTVTILGPLGKLDFEIPPYIRINHDAATKQVTLSVENRDVREQREMWGTTWAYVRNHIRGVSEGHTTVLRLVGIGYRASIDTRPALEEYPGQPFVCLKLGYTHPIDLPVPLGTKASCPQPTRILLEGVDKEQIKSFAARIRKWRVPEPYKGKGIFVDDETIRLKQKKIK